MAMNTTSTSRALDLANQQDFEHRFEIWMSHLLRIGVICSAALVLIGGILYLSRNGLTVPQYHVFRGEEKDLKSVGGITSGARSGNGRAIAQLGLLVLIATPIARVIFSAVGFLLERDFIFVLITLVVLAILLYSLLFH